jgi:hypothetical protein
VLAAAQTAIQNNLNQYTRMQGHPRYQGTSIDALLALS